MKINAISQEQIDQFNECLSLDSLLMDIVTIACPPGFADPNVDPITAPIWLDANGIPYNSINENPPFFTTKTVKIYYNLLLDDRAGLRSAYNQLKTVLKILDNQI